jgi:hypothetical protein
MMRNDWSLKKFNEGWAFAHPLESAYSRGRRRLNANPACSLSMIRHHFRLQQGEGTGDPWEQAVYWQGPRQCPSCAKHLFHPLLYELPSLQRCPIHHIQFTNRCPQCGLPWDRPLTMRTPSCEVCGLLPIDQRGRAQLPAKTYRRLRWLNRRVQECWEAQNARDYVSICDLRATIAWTSDAERSRFTVPALSDPLLLSFESAKRHGRWDRNLQSLEVKTVKEPIRTRLAKVHPWTPPTLGSALIRSTPPQRLHGVTVTHLSRTLLCLALRRLAFWHRSHIPQPHRLSWCDFRNTRPEDFGADGTVCLLCLAFSLWCQAVTMKYFAPGQVATPGHHEICRIGRYSSFSQTPEQVFIESNDGRLFRPTPSLDRWFYLRATDFLFLELMSLVTSVHDKLVEAPADFSMTQYHSRYRTVFPQFASRLIDYQLTHRGLDLMYWFKTPLQELQLAQAIRDSVNRCHGEKEGATPRLWSADPDPRAVKLKDVDAFIYSAAPSMHCGRASFFSWTTHHWDWPGDSLQRYSNASVVHAPTSRRFL